MKKTIIKVNHVFLCFCSLFEAFTVSSLLKLNKHIMIEKSKMCVKFTSNVLLNGNSVDIIFPILHLERGGDWHKPQNSPNK